MERAPLNSTEPTIGALVSDVSRDLSSLVQKEIRLLKSEISITAKFGVMGIAMFVGAAFFAMLAVIMLSVAFAYLIHWNGSGLSLHWAFLIVFAVYLLIAAILGLIGVKKIKHVGPPEHTIQSLQETKAALTSRG